MSWIVLSIASAVLLGFYDIAKKQALRDNAVLPVLYFGIVSGGLVWLPLIIWAFVSPASYPFSGAIPSGLGAREYGLVFGKSALVASSWVFAYFSLKHLPLSIAAPIRATSPLWTILLAVLLMGESLGFGQWVGVVMMLGSFLAFSLVGKLEGVDFHKDRWVAFMIAATLLGACSALYDKYLLQVAGIAPAALQAWFSIGLVLVMLPLYLMWRRGIWPRSEFRWSWAIPMIGLLLLAADFLYFSAIAKPGALISVISPVRRMSVMIPFFAGIVLHREKSFLPKFACLIGLLTGIIVIQISEA